MLQNPDDHPEALDEALTEALDGEKYRAEDWRVLVNALYARRQRIERDLALVEDSHSREEIERQLDEIDAQIAILSEEAQISHFVEDTVKFSYEVRRLSDG